MRRWRAGHAFAWIPMLWVRLSRESSIIGDIVLLRQPLVAGSCHVASLARCETNDKEKTAAIAEAEARITDLTSTIEELTATSARLNTEIKNLEKEVAPWG